MLEDLTCITNKFTFCNSVSEVTWSIILISPFTSTLQCTAVHQCITVVHSILRALSQANICASTLPLWASSLCKVHVVYNATMLKEVLRLCTTVQQAKRNWFDCFCVTFRLPPFLPMIASPLIQPISCHHHPKQANKTKTTF